MPMGAATKNKYRRRRPLASLLVWMQRLKRSPDFLRRRRNIRTAQLWPLLVLVVVSFLVLWTPSGREFNIPAAPIPVKRNSPYQCVANTTAASKSKTGSQTQYIPPFMTDRPLIVEGFPSTPVLDGKSLNLSTHDSNVFHARSSKFPNGPILSTGSTLLLRDLDSSENEKEYEYRLLEVKAYLNYSAIHPDEGVESDICINVMSSKKTNSVSSGEEVFCTHEAFYGGDPTPITKRLGNNAKPYLIIPFGPNGVPLRPGQKLEVGSVSKIYGKGKPLTPEEVEQRDAPLPSEQPVVPGLGKVKTSLDLLALHFEATIVPVETLKKEQRPALRSARVPQRDRSVFPILPTEEAAPLTAYRNDASHPVTIRGLGIFRSMLGHYISGDTLIRFLVDGREVLRYCPSPHRPDHTSAPADDILPMNVEVPPGAIVRVEHSLSSYMPDQYISWQAGTSHHRATPYDLAVYILYDHGHHKDTKEAKDALVPFGEIDVPGGQGELDLNGDGHADFVDYDVEGNIWYDLTHPDGAHDTQHVAIRSLITSRGRFDRPSTTWSWTRNNRTTYMEAKVVDEKEGTCFHLKAKRAGYWTFQYCDETKVSYMSVLASDNVDHVFGDFDGDGRFDRISLIPSKSNGKDLNLFFAKGDGKHYLFEHFIGTIQGRCSEEHVTMQSIYLPSKGRHVVLYHSRCQYTNLLDLTEVDFEKGLAK